MGLDALKSVLERLDVFLVSWFGRYWVDTLGMELFAVGAG